MGRDGGIDLEIDKRKVVVTKARLVNTYVEMWRVSYWTMYQAEKELEGSYFQIMASLIFTAFTLEAYLNHIGKNIFKCWNDLEQLSPQKKLNIITENLKIEKNDSKRPFQTIIKLFKFRNAIAHGKDIHLKTEEEMRIIDRSLNEYMRKRLETEWEKYCVIDNAKWAREDVEKIINMINDKIDIDGEVLFLPNHWSSYAKIMD